MPHHRRAHVRRAHVAIVGTLLGIAAPAVLTPAVAAPVPAPIARAIAAPTRSAKFVARDAARHPAEELAFFGVTPHATVVEIWPGGGYWTQILAPLLYAHGTYDLAMGAPDGSEEEKAFAPSPRFQAMLDANPGVYGHVHLTTLTEKHPDLAPPNSADLVLTFRNFHNWMEQGDVTEMLAAIHKALKPGGILGVEDHRGNTTEPQDPKARDGYVRQAYAIQQIEQAGFKLVGTSEIDANPKDTAHWPQGVWTLPPTLALGATDRAKYQAIGEADNFVLKFRKVGA
jgi:predicted methyltransferase